jgi:hypothetical protein
MTSIDPPGLVARLRIGAGQLREQKPLLQSLRGRTAWLQTRADALRERWRDEPLSATEIVAVTTVVGLAALAIALAAGAGSYPKKL